MNKLSDVYGHFLYGKALLQKVHKLQGIF